MSFHELDETTVVEGTPRDEEAPRRLSFLGFWNTLVLRPGFFFERYFQKGHSPYLFLVLMTVGIARAIDRMETQFAKAAVAGRLIGLPQANSWLVFWTTATLSGAMGGAFFYYLGGWWYDVRVGWAGGRRDRETSRFLYLYSAFIPSLLQVMSMIGSTVSDPKPFPHQFDAVGLAIVSGTLIAATFYAVYVSYRGVRTVTNVSRTGARLWFFILPCLVYTLAFSAALGAGFLGGLVRLPRGG